MLSEDNTIWCGYSSDSLSSYNLRRVLHAKQPVKKSMSNKAGLSSAFTFLFINHLKVLLDALSEQDTILSCLFHVFISSYDCVHCYAFVSLIEMLL